MTPDAPNFDLGFVRRYRETAGDPAVGLTPARLKGAIRAFRAGRLHDLALIMQGQEESDYILAAVAPKAKGAVARRAWEILTVDTKDHEGAAAQKRVLEKFYNNLRVTSVLDQDEAGGAGLLIRQMMDAKGKRYACHHIAWRETSADAPAATLWFVPLWFFENPTGKMRFVPDGPYQQARPMPAGEWLVTRGQGIGIACSVASLLKNMPLTDWVAFCTRFGDAIVEAITDAQPGSPEWALAQAATADVAGGDAIVHSSGVEFKFTFPGEVAKSLPFPVLVERMERAQAALWRGADLSTMSAAGGSGQGASLQGGESALIEQDDAAWISSTLQMKLDRLVLDRAFGPDVPALAYFQILAPDQSKIDLNLRIDDFAVRTRHPVSQKQFAERYGRPLPAPGDELLAPKVAAPNRAPLRGINATARK